MFIKQQQEANDLAKLMEANMPNAQGWAQVKARVKELQDELQHMAEENRELKKEAQSAAASMSTTKTAPTAARRGRREFGATRARVAGPKRPKRRPVRRGSSDKKTAGDDDA